MIIEQSQLMTPFARLLCQISRNQLHLGFNYESRGLGGDFAHESGHLPLHKDHLSHTPKITFKQSMEVGKNSQECQVFKVRRVFEEKKWPIKK